MVQAGAAVDTRDDEPNPTRGFFVDASVRSSQPAWGSAFSFVGGNVTARLYAPLVPSRTIVVAERVIVDGVVGDAPWRERVRFGGLVETSGIGGLDVGRGIRLARYPGRLRLSLQHPARWGIREGLTRDVLAAALHLRWQGAQELEITPLPGGHSEGAVVNIHVSEELDAFSLVPLVAPSISGRQMFVNHPHVASFLRRQMARWLSQQRDLCSQPPAPAALFEAMQTLHQQQLMATLGELAAGLPVFDVTVNPDGRADVKQTGSIPLKA